jgi:uncharacterized integral membrane protein
MQFLKTLFWVIVAVVLVLFAIGNWDKVTINLWGGLQADVNLPLLVIGALLLGFLPTFLFYRARMWSIRRRYEAVPQEVANTPVVRTPPVPEGEPRSNL